MRTLGTLLLLMTIQLQAQQKKIASVALPSNVVYAAVDRPGDLYVILQDGEIQKISKDGVKLASTRYSSPPDLFDPRDGVLAFAYFRAANQFDFLSTDLSVSDSQKVHPEFAIHPWLVCPSRNEIWIMDSVDLSLKKTGASIHLIEKDITWKGASSASDISYVREYQNFLFILHKERGILMVNSMGTIIKTIGTRGLTSFYFLGEELYYSTGDTLHFVDLYSGESRTIPITPGTDFAVVTDERMYLLSKKKLDILEFKP